MDPTKPPPYHMRELMQDLTCVLPATDQGWIGQLVQQRVEEKSAPFQLTSEFWTFVDNALNLHHVPRPRPDQNHINSLREHVHDEFLQEFK